MRRRRRVRRAPPDGPDGGDPTAGLTDYLSPDSFTVQVADLAAFREQLGLPEDADALPDTPADVDEDPADPDRRLLSAAVITMPELSLAIQTLQRDPIAEAFEQYVGLVISLYLSTSLLVLLLLHAPICCDTGTQFAGWRPVRLL